MALTAVAKDGVYRVANCEWVTDDQENRATLDVVLKDGRAVAATAWPLPPWTAKAVPRKFLMLPNP